VSAVAARLASMAAAVGVDVDILEVPPGVPCLSEDADDPDITATLIVTIPAALTAQLEEQLAAALRREAGPTIQVLVERR
jgi:hypothetical protein